MHLHLGEFGEHVRNIPKRDPVELNVLAGREVPVTAVPGARDMRERAHLLRAEQAVGHRNTQHRGMALDVQAIAEPQSLEFVFRKVPGQITRCLVAELRHPLVHKALVDFVVDVHVFRLFPEGAIVLDWPYA